MSSLTALSPRLVLAFSLGLASPLLSPKLAEACSPSACKPLGYAAPRAGATLPSNATTIFYQFTKPLEDVGDGITLTTDAGATSIPLTPLPKAASAPAWQGATFTLGAPLDPSKVYEIRHLQSCTPTQAKPEEYAVQTFSVGASAPLPTSAGALSLASAYRDSAYVVPSSKGSCVAPIDAAVARLGFTPSAELLPWLPITSFQISIDGKSLGGAATGIDPNAEVAFAFYARSPLQLHANCGGLEAQDPWDTAAAPLGTRTVRLEATIAGSATPLVTELDVTFSCESGPSLPGNGGTSGTSGTGGTSGGGAGQQSSGNAGSAGAPFAKGGAGGAELPPTAGQGDDGGCSLSSPPVSRSLGAGSLALLGLLGAIGAIGRRRRPVR